MLKFRHWKTLVGSEGEVEGLFRTHFHHQKYNPNNPTREESVQEHIFGGPFNDYLPYKNHDLNESIGGRGRARPKNRLRVIVRNDSNLGPAGLVVPRHILEGAKNSSGGRLDGMNEINKKRADVYGPEHREPLSGGKMLDIHRSALEEHFAKPEQEQIKAEKKALGRLRSAGHISHGADTLDEGEKTDTVHHEFDEKGRSFIAKSAKGIAGHSFYTSGVGKNQKHHIINTCAGQTVGCCGGVDAHNVADTSKGTCFAPKSEIQYAGAAIRRHCQTQAMVDPKMTKDWILSHVGSLRRFAGKADKQNERALFRPNVLNEMDRGSSALGIGHLNNQRESKGLPPIVSNSYGKTTERHDPENNIHVTYSNTGPKVKRTGTGTYEISENIRRDPTRVLQTVQATNKSGVHLKTASGENAPPKGTYMVISVHRGSDIDKSYQKHTNAIKYWSTGTPEHNLSEEEKKKPAEAHYDGGGKPTTPDKAHYGHTTLTDENGQKQRFHYQMQHVLHPRMVSVGSSYVDVDGNKITERQYDALKSEQKKAYTGKDHVIPTDSRFKDEEYLPKDRYKSPTGKNAGHILVTSPTISTTNEQHHSSFTHHVDDQTVEEIKNNGGVHEIDKPEDQLTARGHEYQSAKPIARPLTIITHTSGKKSTRLNEENSKHANV